MKEITIEKVSGILFINLETVGRVKNFKLLTPEKKEYWTETYDKSSFFNEKYESAEDAFNARSSLYAEYGKIISLHMAYFDERDGKTQLHSKVFSSIDEIDILKQFCKTVKAFNKICSYDGKRFDFPFLIKRLLINGIEIPEVINTKGKKPWEIQNIETLELWQNGNTYYTSLELVCYELGIPLETKLSGEKVSEAFWNKDYDLIDNKCKDEGIANVRLWLKLNEFEDLLDQNILEK